MKSILSLVNLITLSILSLSFAFAPHSMGTSCTSTSIAMTSTPIDNDTTNDSNSNSKPFAIVVEAEIKPERMAEFLDVMERDAVGSRTEPGCLRFDVIQDQSNPNKFFFYEVYTDLEAVNFHKAQPHFALWGDFKKSGGVVKSLSYKCDGIFMSK